MKFILFWLVLSIVFLIIEAMTTALVSVWFFVGSLLALITAYLGFGPFTQTVVFLLGCLITLIVLKPLRSKFLEKDIVPTNLDMIIGKEGEVAQSTTENENLVKVQGKVWSAITKDGETLLPGEKVRVLEIKGVKIIVEKI